MEARITSNRKLQVYPCNYNETTKTAEIIFIEDTLGLKKNGDSILLVRKNIADSSSLAYLESNSDKKNVENGR